MVRIMYLAAKKSLQQKVGKNRIEKMALLKALVLWEENYDEERSSCVEEHKC